MTDQTRAVKLFQRPGGPGGAKTPEIIPSMDLSTSLQPRMSFSSPCFVRGGGCGGDGAGIGGGETAHRGSPEIPLEVLRELTVEMLSKAVRAVGLGVRDPEGGSVELLLVPLIRLFYTLLVMGVFGDEDMGRALRLIEPGVFSRHTDTQEEQEEEGEEDESDGGSLREGEGEVEQKECTPKQGLLQMKLPEAVKLEVRFNKNPPSYKKRSEEFDCDWEASVCRASLSGGP